MKRKSTRPKVLSIRGLLLRVATVVLLVATLGRAQVSDTTPPQLQNVAFAPSSVDVTAGPQTVTVTLGVSDDLSGVASVGVGFTSPSGRQVRGASLALVDGNEQAGTWEAPVQFLQFGESGTWTITQLSFADKVGNFALLDTATLRGLNFPTDVDVISVPDTMPPQLADFRFTPVSIDTSTSAQTVTVTLSLSDGLSGVDSGVVWFTSPSGSQSRTTSLILVDGNEQAGTWDGRIQFPQFSESGTWTITQLFFADRVGNHVFLDSTGLQALGFWTDLNVISVQDTTPPQVADFSFTPVSIDTSLGVQTVTVTADLRDDLSGVGGGCVDFASPSGTQVQIGCFALDPNRGDDLAGIWEAHIQFPRFSESGTWKVISFFFFGDKAGNQGSVTTASLKALGFRTELVVIKPSLIADGILPAGGGTVADSAFGLRAQITTPPGVLGSNTDVSIDVFADPLAIPTPTGFSGPGTYFVNIFLDPTPFPLPPSSTGIVVVLPLINFMLPGTTLGLHRIDPATGLLVPAIDTAGRPVIGTVDAPDGLSATFEGVATLSVVVGLVPIVPSAEAQIEALITDIEDLVTAGVLSSRNGRALKTTLKATLRQLDRGRERAAVLLVRVFVGEVKLLVRRRQLPQQTGNLLVDRAESIIDTLK
jgi:hypothetical protein